MSPLSYTPPPSFQNSGTPSSDTVVSTYYHLVSSDERIIIFLVSIAPTAFTICQTIVDSSSTRTIYSAKYGFRYPDEIRHVRYSGSDSDVEMGRSYLDSFREGYDAAPTPTTGSMWNFQFPNEIFDVNSSDGYSDHHSPSSPSDSISEGDPPSPVSDTFPTSSSSALHTGICLPPALSFYVSLTRLRSSDRHLIKGPSSYNQNGCMILVCPCQKNLALGLSIRACFYQLLCLFIFIFYYS